jgi:hypothetical protein
MYYFNVTWILCHEITILCMLRKQSIISKHIFQLIILFSFENIYNNLRDNIYIFPFENIYTNLRDNTSFFPFENNYTNLRDNI